jgi:hypothetical protein
MAQHKSQSGSKVAAGLGIAALAAAAAGAYFLYGTDAGKQKRKQIKSWSLKMKADVLDRMEKMKDWSEEAYNMVIDNVTEKYKNAKNIDPKEVTAIANDLKRHWKSITRQIQVGKTPTRKASPKRKSAPKKAE